MTLRGLIPSLGAGGSLIAAAVCALAVFGGVLAFRGDDPGAAEAQSGDVVMPAQPTARRQTSSVRRVAAPQARTARGERAAVAERPRRAEPRPRRTAITLRSGDSPVGPPAPTPSGGNRAPAPTSPPATPPTKPETPDVPAVPDVPVPDVPDGTVQRVVEQTSATVQPVVDAVPPPVKAPVQHLTNTVHDVAGTVDDLTGALLP